MPLVIVTAPVDVLDPVSVSVVVFPDPYKATLAFVSPADPVNTPSNVPLVDCGVVSVASAALLTTRPVPPALSSAVPVVMEGAT